jgi:hypothetical protein
MSKSSLEASPIAEFLLSLTQLKATGYVEICQRRISLSKGEIAAVSPAIGDDSFGEFLVKSGLLKATELEHVQKKAENDHITFEAALIALDSISMSDLEWAHRALWLDRLVRSLLAVSHHESDVPTLEHGMVLRTGIKNEPLALLLLNALARCATEGDAELVGQRLNDRLFWVEGPLTDLGRKWAGLASPAFDGPLVSSVLVKKPGAAPQIAAVVRAGIARLLRPGSQPAAARPRKMTLPPPLPRLSLLPIPRIPTLPAPAPVQTAATLAFGDEPAVTELSARPAPPRSAFPSPLPEALEQAGPSPDGLLPNVFDGAISASAGWPGWSLSQVRVREFTVSGPRLDDPFTTLEEQIADLQTAGAAGSEIAPLWCDLARLWKNRIGSIEEAARAYREAAACDLTCQEALEQATLLYGALGDAQNASAYAGIIAVSAQTGAERAHALRFIASLARMRGDLDGCLEALCEAAAEDETNPEPHEQVARILADQGNFEGAIAHARLAAKVWQEEHPERARTTLAWASGFKPGAIELSLEYAELLRATGRQEAAIAVVAETAKQTGDRDYRRRLILHAAQQAEEFERTDLAVELLLEAFDQEPYVDLYYEPLVTDLEAEGLKTDLAVIAEELSTVCAEEQRGYWLHRAARATMPLAGRTETGLLLLYRSVELDPLADAALEHLRQYATTARDRALLADALRLAAEARIRVEPAAAGTLFTELAILAEEQLGAVTQAFDAWKAMQVLAPDDERVTRNLARLAEKVRIHNGLLEVAETELGNAATAAKPKLARKVAAMLRDRPADRVRVADLYEQYVAAYPEDETAASALEWLLAWMGEHRRLAAFLQTRLERPIRTGEREHLLVRLAAEKAREGDFSGVARVCLQLLELSPQHAEGIARLNRAAARTGDPAIWRHALTARAGIAATARQRGRAFARLAKVLEFGGDPEPAVAQADAALVADPTAADAALLILRHAYRLSRDRAVQALDLARSVLGDSQPLLSTLVRAAAVCEDLDTQRGALEAWCWLTPLDAEPMLALLAATIRQGDASAITEAALNALSRDLITPATAAAVHAAVSRLAALGASVDATRLAIEAIDTLGDATLLASALELAGRSGDCELMIAALERAVATERNGARLKALQELAQCHRQRNDALGEVRTLLRLLGQSPRDLLAYDRLISIYSSTGESERSLVIMSLALEATDAIAEKRARLLDMAAAHFQLAGDLRGAEQCIHKLVLDFPLDETWVRNALGTVLSLGNERWACDVSLKIASKVPPETGERACEWLVASAQRQFGSTAETLSAAVRAIELFPANPRLLLLLEKLALDQRDCAAAISTYERLADHAVGLHNRRAIFYRAGRWLELAEEPQHALRYHLKSFALSPSTGAAFTAIERLASACSAWSELVDTYRLLAQTIADQTWKTAILDEAKAICHRKLNGPERAAKLLELSQLIEDQPVNGATDGGAEPLPSPSRTPEASARLRQLIREQPWDIPAIRQLHENARQMSATAEVWITGQILSLFDPTVPGLGPTVEPLSTISTEALEAALDPVQTRDLRRLLSLVWENARGIARLRKPLRSYLVSEDDRLTSLSGVEQLVKAFTATAHCLAMADTPVYLKRSDAVEMFVTATYPAAIVVSEAAQSKTDQLIFQFARCLALTRPENALLATLSPEEGQAVLQAISAAFGPRDDQSPVNRQAAELAAELWRAMPMRAQNEVRALVKKSPGLEDYEAVRGAMMRAAARVGLLVAGDVASSLKTVANFDASLQNLDITEESGFSEASRRSVAFAEVISFALSTTYLESRI